LKGFCLEEENKEGKNAVERELEETTVCNGLIRHTYVHLPPGCDTSKTLPLLIALHGRLGTGKKMSKQTGFNAIADRERFVVVYPDGIKRSWADGRGITRADAQNIDDVAFLDRLIQSLAAKFPVDLAGVYLVGHSNGGFMALRFSIERPRRVAAVAVVAASLTDDLAKRLDSATKQSAFFIHGTADAVTPYEGWSLPGGGRTLPVEDAAKAWATACGCSESPEPQKIDQAGINPRVFVKDYGSSENENQVKLYRLEAGGHAWPGEPEGLTGFGEKGGRHEINAGEEIWEFFKRVREHGIPRG